jgi:hypothetical protein
MTPQVKTLLTHLQKHGSISQAEAGTVYKIRALPRRIADLKALGHKITSKIKKDPTGQRYARYTLVTEEASSNRPTIGDRVVVVKAEMTLGRYRKHSIGTVVAFYDNNPDKLHVAFDHCKDIPVLVFIHEVEVIAND